MEWSKERVRELRLRMGWSLSDLARHLEVELTSIVKIEEGQLEEFDYMKSKLTLFWNQADSISFETHSFALAEKIIEDNNLDQLFQSEMKDQFFSNE